MINNHSHFILVISILIYTLINISLADDCLIHSLTDLNYPKALTLYNGYQLLVTSKGIYSFEPYKTNIAFQYNFTEEQKFSTDITSFKNSINQVELTQFNGENGGKKYVICLANNIIYFIDETGKVIFFQELEKKVDVDYSITLVTYKYYSGDYYFIIGYNTIDTNFQNHKVIYMSYYKITNENKIEYIRERTMSLSEDLNLNIISCHAMYYSSENTKYLVCFINAISYNNYYLNAYGFNPDQDFNFVFMATPLYETVFSFVKVMKSSINDDQTKALVCYSLENNEINVKCFYYNSKENKISEIFINVDYCNTNVFGFNIFFFQQSNEFIFSCVDSSKERFSMKRIDINFNLIEDEDTNFYKKRFEDCDNYDYFSIIYISNYNLYSGIFNSDCTSGKYIRIFMLSNSICIKPNEKEESTLPISPETTIVETTVSIPEITIPHIITTLPEIKITNIPTNEQQIITNSLEFEITNNPTKEQEIITNSLANEITNMPTNEQQIITNSLEIKSPILDTTIQNIITTVVDIDKNKKTDNIPIEQTTITYPEKEKTDIIKKNRFSNRIIM